MIDLILEEIIDWTWQQMRKGERRLLWVQYLVVTVVGMIFFSIISGFLHTRLSPTADTIVMHSIVGLRILLGLYWFVQAIVQKKYFDATGVLLIGLLTWGTVFILGSVGA